MGPLLRTPGAGRRHDGLAGRRRRRDRPLGPARARSPRPPIRPASPRPASHRPIAAGCGTPSSGSPGSPIPVPPATPDWSRHDPPPRAPPTPTCRSRTPLTSSRTSRTPHAWDPGHRVVARSEPGDGPIGVGTRFELGVRHGRPGRADDLPDHALRARRPGSSSSGPDRASMRLTTSASSQPAAGRPSTTRPTSGCGGVRGLVQPFLGGTFERIGRDAAAGMAAHAGERWPRRRDDAPGGR